MRAFVTATVLAVAVGCGSSTSSPPVGSADGGAGGGGSDVDAAVGSRGSATIGGTAGMSTFASAASVWAIDGSDDPTNLVVYIFSKEVACSDIQSPGWDGPAALGKDASLQFLEIKYKTQSVQSFAVVAGPNFGAGEALSNHTLIGRAPNPELGARGGTASIAALAPRSRASGSFDIAFGATESLKGTYDAPFCAGGSEP